MVKILLKSVREYKWMSLLSPVLVAIEVMLETYIPFLMGNIIDYGITPGNLAYIQKWGLVLVGLAVVSLVAGSGASWFSSHAAAGFAQNLRHDEFAQVQKFSFANIEHFSTASVVTRLTTDITNVQQAYQISIRIAFRAPLMFIFSMVMSFRVSPQMAGIFAIVVPILAVILYFIIHTAYPLFSRVFRRYDILNRVVNENLRGIRVIKTFDRQEEEINKFKDASNGIFTIFSKAQRLMAMNAPVMTFMINTTMLLVSWVGAQMIVGKTLETGQLVSLFSYTMSILFSLMMLSNIITMLSVSQASANRIAAILREQPSIVNPDNPITTVKDGSVDFADVSMSYLHASHPSLNDVSLHIAPGTFVGIIGGTGSGKSTLVSLIPRLYDVSSGTVSVGGTDVRRYDLRTLRDAVAMVLQNNNLFSGTIAENLRWGDANATDAEVQKAAAMAQADGFVQEMPKKYDTYIEQGGSNVSGGQKQRLTIARALLKKPKILILDDSTSAVDTETEGKIMTALRTELPNMTKIMISQRITSIAQADQIIVLNNGQINGIGTHEELLKSNAIYKELNESQQKDEQDTIKDTEGDDSDASDAGK
ncbi:ABC transporter ATP-binding protein [Schleiferilactobacillus shenzhenensis]|uniref:ABC transporter ATP-binding protein n=1 Tax=Schleiferilactobacillus shenzhenensis TaxID=1231337 RepID=UPI0004144CC3|nr:ABC transporter ATP-binding protein [Schleiferilactobacillus shenzhenensis]